MYPIPNISRNTGGMVVPLLHPSFHSCQNHFHPSGRSSAPGAVIVDDSTTAGWMRALDVSKHASLIRKTEARVKEEDICLSNLEFALHEKAVDGLGVELDCMELTTFLI